VAKIEKKKVFTFDDDPEQVYLRNAIRREKKKRKDFCSWIKKEGGGEGVNLRIPEKRGGAVLLLSQREESDSGGGGGGGGGGGLGGGGWWGGGGGGGGGGGVWVGGGGFWGGGFWGGGGGGVLYEKMQGGGGLPGGSEKDAVYLLLQKDVTPL